MLIVIFILTTQWVYIMKCKICFNPARIVAGLQFHFVALKINLNIFDEFDWFQFK